MDIFSRIDKFSYLILKIVDQGLRTRLNYCYYFLVDSLVISHQILGHLIIFKFVKALAMINLFYILNRREGIDYCCYYYFFNLKMNFRGFIYLNHFLCNQETVDSLNYFEDYFLRKYLSKQEFIFIQIIMPFISFNYHSLYYLIFAQGYSFFLESFA